MKKYEPLGNYLAALPATQERETLTFAKIEEIIGDRLADSAYERREWWANQAHGSRAYHWENAGFIVDKVNRARGVVIFRRGKVTHAKRGGKARSVSDKALEMALREIGVFPQQFDQPALVVRIEMLNQHERHAGVRGQVLQKLAEGLQTPGGGADADDRESAGQTGGIDGLVVRLGAVVLGFGRGFGAHGRFARLAGRRRRAGRIMRPADAKNTPIPIIGGTVVRPLSRL